MKTQHSKAIELSETVKLTGIDEKLHTASPWVAANDSSIFSYIVCGRQIIQFYSNSLLDLPEAINAMYINISY